MPEPNARDAAAILLTLIAAISIGFVRASQGRLSIAKQVAGGVCFIGLAYSAFSWIGGGWLSD